MATWVSNGADTGGSGGYSPGTQSVQYILSNFASSGDIITLPSGTFTWNTGVNVANAGGNLSVTIQGNNYSPNTATGNSPTGTTQGCGASPGAPTLFTTISYAGGVNRNPADNNYEAIGSSGLPTTGKVFRVTGIKFTGVTNSAYQYIVFGGSSSTDQYRIDNCYFDSGTVQSIMVAIYGYSISGVMDHCTLNGGGASEMVHCYGAGAGIITGWTDDVTPGSSHMLFFEDCIAQLNNYSSATAEGGTSMLQSYYGAKTVVRNCQLNFCQIDQHGTQGSIGARWFEFYNNTEFFPTGVTGATSFYALRGGSGVIYNNAASGTLTFSFQCQLYTDDATSNTTYGTAPNFGPGSGIFKNSLSQGPTSSPVYLWNNDTHIGVSTQVGNGGWTPSPIAANSNWFVSTNQPSSMLICERSTDVVGTTTYSYSPYTYPHPLTGLSTSPGSGLTATADASITKYVVGVTSGAYVPPTNLYLACFSSQFSNGPKAGATEWTTSSNPAYARTVMGANPTASWTIAAYASGTGVVFKNTNAVSGPAVTGNNQSCYSLGFCLASTVGVTDIQLFIDMPNDIALSIPIGFYVYLPALTGAIFTTE